MKRYKENETDAVAVSLAQGSLMAFPTDTVFGLGTMYGSLDRLQRLKHAKHRPETKPVPFMTDSWTSCPAWLLSPKKPGSSPGRFFPGR